MSKITGIVSEVINNGRAKGSGLMVNGEKYGVFDPSEIDMDRISVGDEVTFDVQQKGQYKNIARNSFRKTGNTGAPVQAPPNSRGSKPSGGFGGRSNEFPVPALDGARSIIRQNALAHATSMVNTFCLGCDNEMTLETRMKHILNYAGQFEEFSAGDDVAKAAEEALQSMYPSS